MAIRDFWNGDYEVEMLEDTPRTSVALPIPRRSRIVPGGGSTWQANESQKDQLAAIRALDRGFLEKASGLARRADRDCPTAGTAILRATVFEAQGGYRVALAQFMIALRRSRNPYDRARAQAGIRRIAERSATPPSGDPTPRPARRAVPSSR